MKKFRSRKSGQCSVALQRGTVLGDARGAVPGDAERGGPR